jgi:uncharacterized repeat protein (TIGR04138 family)
MPEPPLSIVELLRQDKRYKIEAYAFVFDGLRYGHEKLGLGTPRPAKRTEDATPAEGEGEGSGLERHLTGQELCQAIRQYALEQYGYMAKCVLESWGVRSTGDLGEIVFNLIRAGEMRKTDDDRREDFDNVFDFETGLCAEFQIQVPDEPPRPGA